MRAGCGRLVRPLERSVEDRVRECLWRSDRWLGDEVFERRTTAVGWGVAGGWFHGSARDSGIRRFVWVSVSGLICLLRSGKRSAILHAQGVGVGEIGAVA